MNEQIPENLSLAVRKLHVSFDTEEGRIHAVQDVSLDVENGKTLCVVGESGCGKSVTGYSIMQLIPSPPGHIESGQIYLRSKQGQLRNLLELSKRGMADIRGGEIAMIFQEPMTALNPVQRIGAQIDEILKIHKKMNRKQRREKIISLLNEVGIASPVQAYARYPHQMSGGQRQRVVIAIALACDPRLLIADEPTTALDVTVQAQILDLLAKLQKRHKMSVILITHDLAVVAEVADQVAVMYAGSVVEVGSVDTIFNYAGHPYSQALLDSLPSLGENERKLKAIEGRVPKLLNLGPGCRFANRCELRKQLAVSQAARCENESPELKVIAPRAEEQIAHSVRCHFVAEQMHIHEES